MNRASASLHKDESEFDFANVERCVSYQVIYRSVKDSPIRYECTLRKIIPISDLPKGGTVILLDVKCVYVRDDLYEDGNIKKRSIDSVVSGPYCCSIGAAIRAFNRTNINPDLKHTVCQRSDNGTPDSGASANAVENTR